MNTADDFPNLYSITGKIIDINRMLVNRAELRCILKDVARYRWLKRNSDYPPAYIEIQAEIHGSDTLDEAIDSELARGFGTIKQIEEKK